MTCASAPLTPVVFHVLLSLSRGALHGYAVMKRVEEDSGLAMGPGTVYGALQRLTEGGWVEEVEDTGGDARRGRSFALTTRGREALRGEAERITSLARRQEIRELLPPTGAQG